MQSNMNDSVQSRELLATCTSNTTTLLLYLPVMCVIQPKKAYNTFADVSNVPVRIRATATVTGKLLFVQALSQLTMRIHE